ncbi:imidazole glycerol phosphate synthase subunit HisH [Ascidiaceihabitans sp.]|nr:imidazole glycerol phosphate synthase subunit HisH [Ascidiaceihabitans sp.]
MIGVINIGLGNVESVYKALRKLDYKYVHVNSSSDLEGVSKIIFPGVGTFKSAMENLTRASLVVPLQQYLADNRPYLGICLGMQLLATEGEEVGLTSGLAAIKGRVTKMEATKNCRLPHVGWNVIDHNGEGLFDEIHEHSDFYFVHSYSLKLLEPVEYHECNYFQKITAYVRKGNIHGCQFHPEKSQIAGLKLMENFLKNA